MKGVVAAGHPLTAEPGAEILRQGGNAVDAAIGAVLASFATESPLTGLGAGGFMLVHTGEEDVLIDFFVAVPGLEVTERRSELIPIPVYFERDQAPQIFNIGAASCGVPGTPAGLALAAERFGSVPLAELARPARDLAWEGVPVSRDQAYIFSILEPILTRFEEARSLYAPEGRILREGDTFRFPDLAESLDRFGAEGADPFYRGEVAERVSETVASQGGTVSMGDMAAYQAIEREPVGASFRGTEVLTNPPPSSGGILIALCLELLDRLGDRSGVEEVVAVSDAANQSRTEEFLVGLFEEGYAERFLSRERLDEVAGLIGAGEFAGGGTVPDDRLGSTTHIAALDTDGMCASVTCSNGTGSGLVVPGTGIHVNNMLGEEDLNPLGFHRHDPGRRVPSMMAPTVVLRGGDIVLGLGSGGSNRIRSTILQTIIRVIEEGLPAEEAVGAPRLHFEQGTVQAEPGIDELALGRLESAGVQVARWRRLNLYFGGCQAVARDPSSGEISGGGDPRRGGAVGVA